MSGFSITEIIIGLLVSGAAGWFMGYGHGIDTGWQQAIDHVAQMGDVVLPMNGKDSK